MLVSLLSSLLLLAPGLAWAQTTYNSFAGCYIASGLPTGPDDVSMSSGTTISRETCQAYCIAQSTPGNPFFFSHVTSSTTTFICTCTERSIAVSKRFNAGSGNTCATGSISSSYLQTTFDHIGCTLSASIPAGLVLSGTTTDTRQCFVLCAGDRYVAWRRPTTSPATAYECYCGNPIVSPVTGGTCAAGANHIYAHSPEAAASGLTRRKMREKLAECKGKEGRLCPGGMRACVIQGMNKAYECIDTTTEMESCGGCLHGELDSQNMPLLRASIGMDCSTIEGVDPTGVTCLAGRCRSFRCNEGYTLQDGRCETV